MLNNLCTASLDKLFIKNILENEDIGKIFFILFIFFQSLLFFISNIRHKKKSYTHPEHFDANVLKSVKN